MDAPPLPVAAIEAARAAIKAQLRIESAADDAAIDMAARTALMLGEAFTGAAWIERGWQTMLATTPGWQPLPIAPVTAITRLEAIDASGAATALPADHYRIDIDPRGEGWVELRAPLAGRRARVTFDAGLAPNWEALPPPLAQGAALLAAHCLEARTEGTSPPVVIAALWRPWRRLRLTTARRGAC